jgi:hypothetical protein
MKKKHPRINHKPISNSVMTVYTKIFTVNNLARSIRNIYFDPNRIKEQIIKEHNFRITKMQYRSISYCRTIFRDK